MRPTAGCVAVLSTLCLAANAASSYEFDFHVDNLEVNGVRRTVVNGQSLSSCICRLDSGLTYALSFRSIPG